MSDPCREFLCQAGLIHEALFPDHFLPTGYMLFLLFFRLSSLLLLLFFLLHPWCIKPFPFPLYNHISLYKHQRKISRTKLLRKMRPMTHKRMFFYFSFIQLFSEEPRHLLIMRLAASSFLGVPPFGFDCQNLFSAIY